MLLFSKNYENTKSRKPEAILWGHSLKRFQWKKSLNNDYEQSDIVIKFYIPSKRNNVVAYDSKYKTWVEVLIKSSYVWHFTRSSSYWNTTRKTFPDFFQFHNQKAIQYQLYAAHAVSFSMMQAIQNQKNRPHYKNICFTFQCKTFSNQGRRRQH